MKENTVIAFRNPADFQEDPLTEVLQAGARKLLTQAVEAEATLFLDAYAAFVDDAGRRRVVRNGHLPERAIQKAVGRARRWRRMIETGRCRSITDLAEQEKVTPSYVNRLLPLG